MKFASLKNKLLTAAVIAGALANSGCSNQWREANFDIDGEEVAEILNTIQAEGTAGDTSTHFFELWNDENSIVFFADDRPEFGGIPSVFSIIDYSFLGSTFEGLFVNDFVSAKIAFIIVPVGGGYDCSLMVDVLPTEDLGLTDQMFFNCSYAAFDKGEFVAELEGSVSSITLRSFDVVDGFFKDVIQLRLGVFQGGVEVPNGKFSTLVGFGL